MASILVTVKFNRKGVVSIDPYRVTIKYNKLDGSPDDRVKWVSTNAPLTILFNKNGTPFTGVTNIGVPTAAGGATSPAPTKLKKIYLYTMIIQPNDGPPITVDPEVEVDSGGPPPGQPMGGGKKKKK